MTKPYSSHLFIANCFNAENSKMEVKIVDFLEASHIRYDLTVYPIVYVSYIRQFWSTARVETMDGETKILAKVNGRQKTVFESSIRRHLKLNDEEGISTLPENELFKNLSLMGYNILPNQRFSFQKGQFSHQWKFLVHTIMQCLSPKSTSFNEFSSNNATALVCLATSRTYNFSKMIFDGMMRNVKSKGIFLMYPRTVELFASMLVPQGEGLEHPSDPHHTPSDQDEPMNHEQTTSPEPTIPSQYHSVITTPWRITRGTIRISQSKVPSHGVDETAFPIGDVRYEKAFPTDTSLDAGQDRENIAKTSAMPHEALPRVTSLGGGEGSFAQEDALNTTGIDQGEDLIDRDKSADKWSDSTDEMSYVLGTLGAANILASGGLRLVFTTSSLSVATASTGVSPAVATASGSFSIAIEEKFISVWEKMQDFVPMNSKLESERLKRPGIQLDKERIKKLKITKASGTEPTQEQQSEEPKELSEEELKKMIELVPVEELYIEALQVKWSIKFRGGLLGRKCSKESLLGLILYRTPWTIKGVLSKSWIRRIGKCEYAFSCEVQELIRRIPFGGYGRIGQN
nr:synaptobrevin, longin-like domain protein [Tanacetum cinerariifolium]